MCNPIALGVAMMAVSTATSIGASASATSAQNATLRGQRKAGDENYQKTVEAVNKDIGLQTDALMAQHMETIDAQKQQLHNIGMDARAASSSYATALAESGIAGNTVQLVHDQFQREVLEYSSAARRNITNYTAQVNREAGSIYARGQSIINGGYPAPLPAFAQVQYGTAIANGLSQGLSLGLQAHQAGIGAPTVGTLPPSGGGTYQAPQFNSYGGVPRY